LRFLLFFDLLDRPRGRGFGHHLLGPGSDVRLRHRRRDRHRSKLDHDRGGGFRRLDLLAPIDRSRRDGAMREHDDRAADRPAAQIGKVFGAQRHHGVFSSPTSATFR
jgi:hypothetical protein